MAPGKPAGPTVAGAARRFVSGGGGGGNGIVIASARSPCRETMRGFEGFAISVGVAGANADASASSSSTIGALRPRRGASTTGASASAAAAARFPGAGAGRIRAKSAATARRSGEEAPSSKAITATTTSAVPSASSLPTLPRSRVAVSPIHSPTVPERTRFPPDRRSSRPRARTAPTAATAVRIQSSPAGRTRIRFQPQTKSATGTSQDPASPRNPTRPDEAKAPTTPP